MNRFSKENFYRLASNVDAVKKLLAECEVDIYDQKLTDQINKFFNIKMFKFLGFGSYAQVYQINDKEVLRISRGVPPQPLPNDLHVNQRTGFLKINGYYIEKFPLLNTKDIKEVDTVPVIKNLEEKYPEVWDMHGANFGRDPETGKVKTLDPGMFLPRKKEHELLDEAIFMELQKQYPNLLDAVKANSSNIAVIPPEYQTEQMALEAVKRNGLCLQYVKNRTPETCMAAVKEFGLALEYVPEQKQTFELCLAAVEQNPRALRYIKNPEIKEQVSKKLNLEA